jgi:hypothetical protein
VRPRAERRGFFDEHDSPRQNPFEKATLLQGIRRGDETMHRFDSESGATSPEDPRSKFVVISDRSGGGHYLAIPTPNGGASPSSIFAVQSAGADHLGRMWRSILTQAALPRRHAKWSAWVHLPKSAAIDILHVHGTTPDSDAVGDWPSYLKTNGYALERRATDYALYVHPGRGPSGRTVVAVADARLGTPGSLTTATDGALGQMLLAVAAEAKKRGIESGKIAVNVNEGQIVVRTEGGGGGGWKDRDWRDWD